MSHVPLILTPKQS